MKKIYFLIPALAGLFFTTCKNPLENVDIQVDANVFHYTGIISVTDANGQSLPNDLSVTLTGEDAGAIYDLDGNKDFKVNNGLLGFGVNPKIEPSSGNPLKFNVQISGDGYLPVNIPVQIGYNQFNNASSINLLSLSNPPAGVSVETPSINLSDDKLNCNCEIETKVENGSDLTSKVNLSTGTQFLDASGTVISGDKVNTTLVQLDPAKETAVSLFPGGNLAAASVIGSGDQLSNGVFNPAAVLSVDMKIGTEEVRKFNQPISITMQIEPSYFNSKTGATVQAGDVLDIYSFRTAEGQWRYEGTAPVVNSGGNLTVTFQTSHLTWFLAGSLDAVCEQTTLKLDASAWIQDAVDYPLSIQIYSNGLKTGAPQIFNMSKSNTQVPLANVPLNSTIKILSQDGEELADVSSINCGGITSVVLSKPLEHSRTTLQLYVRCPGNTATVTVLPTFYLYYREAGQGDYRELGVVTKGYISTTALDQSKSYDFKAVWGDHVKIVNNKTVAADNTATVGTEPGDILGSMAAQNNLEVLTETCQEYGL